jgi:hypothetical protein
MIFNEKETHCQSLCKSVLDYAMPETSFSFLTNSDENLMRANEGFRKDEG